jgi:hypothetical protein
MGARMMAHRSRDLPSSPCSQRQCGTSAPVEPHEETHVRPDQGQSHEQSHDLVRHDPLLPESMRVGPVAFRRVVSGIARTRTPSRPLLAGRYPAGGVSQNGLTSAVADDRWRDR